MEDPVVRLLIGLIALGIGGLVAWATVSIRRDQREILRLQRQAADDLEGVESHTGKLRALAEEAEARRAEGERSIQRRRDGVLAELAAVADEAAARREERERLIVARREQGPTGTLRSPMRVVGDEDDVLPRR